MFSSRFSDIFCDFSPQHPHCEFLQTPSCATMNRTSIICPQVSAMEVCSFQSPVLLRRKILDLRLVGICPPRIFSDGHGSRRCCQDRPVTICHKRSWIPWCVAHMPAAAESFTPGQRYRHSCRCCRSGPAGHSVRFAMAEDDWVPDPGPISRKLPKCHHLMKFNRKNFQ